MYSFGFQQAFERGIEASDNVFLTKVLVLFIRRSSPGFNRSFTVF